MVPSCGRHRLPVAGDVRLARTLPLINGHRGNAVVTRRRGVDVIPIAIAVEKIARVNDLYMHVQTHNTLRGAF
jgi:hypothetical protein